MTKSFRRIFSLLLTVNMVLIVGNYKMEGIKEVTKITPAFKVNQNFKLKKAEVRSDGSKPTLYVNEVPVPMVMFTQWVSPPARDEFMEYPNYVMQAQYAGITIYQPRNEGKNWETVMADIVKKDKNALFVLPIWVQSGFPLANVQEHYDTTATGVYSIGSLEWKKAAAEFAVQTIEGYLTSAYKDRIIGFMPTAGNTGEWFDGATYQLPGRFDESPANLHHFKLWLQKKYGSDQALSAAWQQDVCFDTVIIPPMVACGPFLNPKEQQPCIDYMIYHSDCYAEAIETIGKAIKKACDNTRVVMVAYGYLMALAQHNNATGSAAFDKLLRGEGVDIFCSPLAYTSRGYNEAATWHGFADSCRLHGKLWFSEDDTATYMNTARAYDWYKTSTDFENSNSFLWKNFAAAVTKGYGFWWYDNYGSGMMNSPQALYNMGLMNATVNASYKMKWESRTEIAIVLDEGSVFYQTPGAQKSPTGRFSFNDDLASFRHYLSLIGAPFDIISLRDVVEGKAQAYRLYIFANAYALDETQSTSIEKLKKDGKGLLFIRTPGIVDKSDGMPTLKKAQALTGLDLRLAVSDNNNTWQFGDIRVDSIGSLTEKPITSLYTDFDNAHRPHMFAEGVDKSNVLLSSENGKAIAVMTPHNEWTTLWADDISLLTPELLRKICDHLGIHIYNRDNTVVNADNRFVSVTVDGQKTVTIFFPDEETVYEITTNREYSVKNGKITLSQNKQVTYFFYCGSRDDISMERPVMLDTAPKELIYNQGHDTLWVTVGTTPQIYANLRTTDGLNVFYHFARTWTVGNKAIMDVDADGNITPHKPGNTTVTLEIAGFKQTITVTVCE